MESAEARPLSMQNEPVNRSNTEFFARCARSVLCEVPVFGSLFRDDLTQNEALLAASKSSFMLTMGTFMMYCNIMHISELDSNTQMFSKMFAVMAVGMFTGAVTFNALQFSVGPCIRGGYFCGPDYENQEDAYDTESSEASHYVSP